MEQFLRLLDAADVMMSAVERDGESARVPLLVDDGRCARPSDRPGAYTQDEYCDAFDLLVKMGFIERVAM